MSILKNSKDLKKLLGNEYDDSINDFVDENICKFIKEKESEFTKSCNENQTVIPIDLMDTNEGFMDLTTILLLKIDKTEKDRIKELMNDQDNTKLLDYLRDNVHDCRLLVDGLDDYAFMDIKSNKIRFNVNKLIKEVKDCLDWNDFQDVKVFFR